MDANGNKYWRFSEDCWIFREVLKRQKKEEKVEWEALCTDLAQVQTWVESMRDSRNTVQKKLVKTVDKVVLPGQEDLERARINRQKAAEKRAMLEMMPRRQSSRVARKVSCGA